MKEFSINYPLFLSKNIFWYSILAIINETFNPANWWICQHFWGGVLFMIFEFFILSSCLKENKNQDGN